jgi:hypothetical protein
MANMWSENFLNKSKDWELTYVNFSVDLYMSLWNQHGIACCAYFRSKYIILNFHCHVIKYHSMLFL